MNKVAIVLPAYNEEVTIEETIRSFHAEMADAEIWVIDNKSIDNTNAIACRTIESLGVNGGVIFEPRKGKGNAVRRAFHDIDADVYVLADADMTYPANQIRSLIAPIINGSADMVVGDRHSGGQYEKENKRPLHTFGNTLVQVLVNKLFRASLVDIMSGYRAFNRRFVKNYPILVEGFEVETDMTLHALDKRMRIIEVSVEYKDRPEGSFSKLNTVKDGLRVINTISSILRHYKPFTFFGLLSLLLFLLGIAASVPVIKEWVETQYIHHVPLAILATGLEISAILFLATGLILDSIAHQDKRNFERDLLNHK
jgi:glycosyltransferase involved in cell wall biosynthesis